MCKLPVIVIALCLSGAITHAQDQSDTSDVHVTTQDYTNLRLGPGENWDIITTLEYGVTLRATGRSFDNRWIQVIYDGEVGNPDGETINGVTHGWVVYWLLVWTGDILDLPITNVNTVRWAHSTIGQRGITKAMLVPSGRLWSQLHQTIKDNENNWNDIAQRWYDLDSGFQTTCNNIPPLTTIPEKRFTEKDLVAKTVFVPVVNTLYALIDNMNAATTLFEEVCNRDKSQHFATADDVTTALDYVEAADRQLNTINLFLIPLERIYREENP